jgi:hypothetical protein
MVGKTKKPSHLAWLVLLEIVNDPVRLSLDNLNSFHINLLKSSVIYSLNCGR